jgi:hypothetical protein
LPAACGMHRDPTHGVVAPGRAWSLARAKTAHVDPGLIPLDALVDGIGKALCTLGGERVDVPQPTDGGGVSQTIQCRME